MKNNYSFGLWREQLMALLLCIVCLFPLKSSAQVTLGTQEFLAGTGDATPYNFLWESRRIQFVYTAAEITAAGGAAGDITSLAWDVNQLIGGALVNYEIKMATVTEANVANPITATFTTVRNAANLVPGNTGFYVIPFDTPFTWDGTSNILVDVCWGVNPGFSSTGRIWMYNNVSGQRRSVLSGSANQCNTAPGTVANLKPRVQFQMPLLPACTGTPTAGTAIASITSTCAGGSSLISISGGEATINLEYLWEQSIDGGATWNPATGTNNTATYTTPALTQTTSYRRVTTCINGGASAISSPVEVSLLTATFATLPFSESFDAWISTCGNSDIPGTNWRNTPVTGNNSWRRQDQGATANWSFLPIGIVTPFQGAGAANFHSYGASGGLAGTLDLYINLEGTNVANPKKLTFRYQNATGTDRLEVLLSTDGGATFSAPLATYNSPSSWTLQTLDITGGTANSIIRFRAVSDFGNDDIGIDNLDVVETFPCAGVPAGGTTNASITDFCLGVSSTLSVTGASDAGSTGLTFLWQISTDGGANWVAAVGTNTNATYVASQDGQYRRQITCTTSGESATSTPVSLVSSYSPTSFVFSATNPFLEDFETWENGCNNSDIASTNWKNTPSTGNNSWRRQNQGATANWSFLPTGIVTPISGTGAANFHSYGASNGLQGALDLYVNMSAATGPAALRFLYQNATGTDNLRILLSTDGGASFTQLGQLFTATWAEQLFVFSSTSPNTIIRFLATSDFGFSDIGLDDVSLEEVLPCSGTPVAGIATILPNNTCVASTAVVSIVEDENTDLREFQWQSSPNNTTWADIAGETDEALTVSNVATTTWYRRITTCTASGESAVSTSVSFQVPFATVYATLPYLENFEASWINGCATRDIPNNSWKNTPATGNNSWRRQNDGASAGWAFLGDPEPFFLQVIPVSGTGAAAFHSYGAGLGQVGTFDVFVNASVPGNKQVKFLYNNRDGSPFGNTDQLQVQLSTDGGVTFTNLLTLGVSNTWSTQTVPFTSDSPTTVIRFRATSDFGGSDIGIDDVQVVSLTPCAGIPVGGVATASAPNTCTTPPITVSISGSSEDTSEGLTFLWEVSTDGGTTWITAPGANTGSTYQASPSVTSLYRRVTTCTAIGASTPSSAATIQVLAATFATLPFTENFESWSNRCATLDVPGTNWINTPVTGNNSWRRQDQGASANWQFLADPEPFFLRVVPISGVGAAAFHSYGTPAGQVGTLDVFVNANTPGDKQLKFLYNNRDGSPFGNTDQLQVQLSTDGGGTFTTLLTLGASNTWTTQTVLFTSNSATTIIRFRATSDFGGSDIGIDDVQVIALTPCAGMPLAGTTVAAPINSCNNPEVTASVVGSSEDTQTGLTFLWEQSIDGGTTWIPASGVNTNSTYTATPSATTQYRRVITCTASGQSAISTPTTFTVIVPVYAAIPYTQTFESSWIDGCADNDLPDIHWRNTPTTGNNSWRRQDEGATAGWSFLGNFAVVPQINVIPISGNGAATFHSHGTFSGGGVGETGTLDLYLDLSPAGTKALSFLYSNREVNLTAFGFPTINDDVLNVYQSTDGGVTFTLLETFGEANSWQDKFIILSSNSANTVIRFECVRDGGNSNIGIDNVSVKIAPPCENLASLVGGAANASPNDFCVSTINEITVVGSSANSGTGFTYQWQASTNGGATWTNIEGETGATLTVASAVTTSYRRVIICEAGGTSAFSTAVEILASPIGYATLPFEESFDTWTNFCAINDVPNTGTQVFWKNTPATGNTSWRRQDQGASAGWTFNFAPARPNPFEGTGLANFHSYGAGNGTQGTLDFYIDASSPNQKILTFQYNNAPSYNGQAPFFGNTDQLEVLVSTDGGATFGTPILTLGATVGNEITGWTAQQVVIPSESATTVVRLRATSDFGDTDMGVDNLAVIAPFNNDVGVTAINLDLCSPAFSNVVVEITNFGTQPASNFGVSYTLAGGTTITENFTGTIEPFGTATFTFNAPVSLQVGTLNLTASTVWILDENPSNDAFNRVFENAVAGQALPYFTNFNDGLPTDWTNIANASGWFSATPNNPPAFNGTFPDNPSAYAFDIDQGPAFDGNNAFMAVDDDAAGLGGPIGRDFLVMPRLNLSNYSDVNLTFDIFFEAIGTSNFTVDVSTNGGTTYDAPIYTRTTTTNWITETVSLAAYEGQSSVTIRFTYFDGNTWAYGVALDNVGVDGTLQILPNITVSTPPVADAFVLQGTQNHILYKMDLAVFTANATLSDIVFTTAGTYDDDDLVANSFRLWYSTDDVLGVGDTQLGAYQVVVSGNQLIFNCLSQPINIGTIGYLFLTVDIDPAGTIGNTVFVTTPSITTNVIFLSGNVTGTTAAGGVQTIVGPNTPPTSADNRVQTIKNVAYTFAASDFAFADVDAGDVLQGVKISATNLPPGATLTLGGAPVVQGSIISVANITNLVFTPAPNDVRTNYASITFKVSDGRDLSELRYTLIIDVISDEIFVPRLFSPNGDAANETFRILGGEGNIAKINLKIFDRNNNLVFETSDIARATQTGWDGTKDGTEQPSGAYIWLIEGTYNDGKPLEFEGKKTGVIRLLR